MEPKPWPSPGYPHCPIGHSALLGQGLQSSPPSALRAMDGARDHHLLCLLCAELLGVAMLDARGPGWRRVYVKGGIEVDFITEGWPAKLQHVHRRWATRHREIGYSGPQWQPRTTAPQAVERNIQSLPSQKRTKALGRPITCVAWRQSMCPP